MNIGLHSEYHNLSVPFAIFHSLSIDCGNNLLLQAMKLKIKKIQRKNQKPEFSRNPKIFKKTIENTEVPRIFRKIDCFVNIFRFLKIQVFDFLFEFS